jgi:signal transduction histidine kinase
VQPSADHPFTNIAPDGEWSNSTHPGMQYAAILVGPDFHPQSKTDVLPTEGVMATAISKGEPPFWRRWWFPLACVIAAALLIFCFHCMWLYRMSKTLNLRFEERLGERMRVAQELHDTLLQGLLSVSMQLHVAVDQLPAESPARPGLDRVLQLMGQIIEEGRNTLRGLRASVGSAPDLASSLSNVPQEFGEESAPDFRVIVVGPVLALRPGIRDEVYRIAREAVLNAYRHSQATQIEVELEYAPGQLRALVRDNGSGIDPQIVQSGRDGHWGLSGMRERAELIGAKLRVWSRSGEGTEVELRVPSSIAFESYRSAAESNWLVRLYRRYTRAAESVVGKRVA